MSSATKVNEVVRHAAETTKHAASATAHTLANLAGEAQEKLEELPLPVRRRRRRTGGRRILIAVVAAAAIAAVAKRIRDRRHASDDRSVEDAAQTPTDSPAEPSPPLSSVG